MSHKYELNLIVEDSEDTSEDITLFGEFSDIEWELLEDFLQYADELFDTQLIQAGGWGELQIKWEQDSMTVLTKLPEWDPVIVFLHKFRPLLLQNESTNFYKICNILAKELNHMGCTPFVRHEVKTHQPGQKKGYCHRLIEYAQSAAVGEAEAGSAGEQPARNSQLETHRDDEEGATVHAAALSAFQLHRIDRFPYASENSCLRFARLV